MSGARLDLDDVSRCPVGPSCATCGEVDDLSVCIIATPVGVACTTLCGGCADTGTLPRIASWTAAIHVVAEHCGHLGCDVDEMAAAMERGPR